MGLGIWSDESAGGESEVNYLGRAMNQMGSGMNGLEREPRFQVNSAARSFDRRLLTVRQAAEYLGVRPPTLYD